MKFEVGKKYVVTEGRRKGVIIKITGIDGRLTNFEVVSGKMGIDFFERDSNFSKWLKPVQ